MADLGGRSNERDLLNGVLDWQRAVVENKVDGLPRDEAARVMTPSGLSPLGVVQHLALGERGWFRDTFAGEDVEVPASDDTDNSSDFVVAPEATVDSVVRLYQEECAHARRITASSSLDDLSANEAPFYGQVSLRWVLVHMIEETARHAGHLDLMCEHIDGRTGD